VSIHASKRPTIGARIWHSGQPDDAAGVPRSAPAGIVFHTPESRQLPFEAGANGALKNVGEGLIDFLCRRHAYH